MKNLDIFSIKVKARKRDAAWLFVVNNRMGKDER